MNTYFVYNMYVLYIDSERERERVQSTCTLVKILIVYAMHINCVRGQAMNCTDAIVFSKRATVCTFKKTELI